MSVFLRPYREAGDDWVRLVRLIFQRKYLAGLPRGSITTYRHQLDHLKEKKIITLSK